MTLLLLGASLIFSRLSGQILEQAQKNYFLISAAISSAVGIAFIVRLTLYMGMGQGGAKYAKLFRETVEYYVLTISFPFLIYTIIDTANSVAQSIMPKMELVSRVQLERELSFPGITTNINILIKWLGITIGSWVSQSAHGIHVGLIYLLYGLAPVVIFSHTMFNFTLAFPVFLGVITVLSLWPVAAAISSVTADGVYHLVQSNSGDALSVLTLFSAYVGISLLNLIIPFILFYLASGHGPVSSFKVLKKWGSKGVNNMTSSVKNGVSGVRSLPELPSKISHGWREFKGGSRELMHKGSQVWSNFKGGMQAGVSHMSGAHPQHHHAARGMMAFPHQLASGIRAFAAFQGIGKGREHDPHGSYLSHATRMSYRESQILSPSTSSSSEGMDYERNYPSIVEDDSYLGLKTVISSSVENQAQEPKKPKQSDYVRSYGSNQQPRSSAKLYSGSEISNFGGNQSSSAGKDLV